MSLLSRLPDAVEILRAGSVTDAYGNASKSWADADVVKTPTRGWLQQTSTVETTAPDRSALVVGWVVYLPPDTDLTARDRVRVNGRTFEVDGEPYAARGLRGVACLRAALRRTEG